MCTFMTEGPNKELLHYIFGTLLTNHRSLIDELVFIVLFCRGVKQIRVGAPPQDIPPWGFPLKIHGGSKEIVVRLELGARFSWSSFIY